LRVAKTEKSRWRVATGGASSVRVRYNVYAFELTVRTSHLDGTHAYFNPATLCMYLPGRLNEPHQIEVQAQPGWKVTTGLDAVDGAANTFLASDYDELVDAPFECGTHRVLTFEVDGIPHELAIYGQGNEDQARLLADTQCIVEEARDMFGALPYRRYVFLLTLTDGLYGGLEHRNSVSNMIDRWTFRPEKSYERYLGLTSHEFFHVWNVKRIRPAPLGPFDYSRENYTRQLWVAEGITSYYDNLLLERSQLVTPERYLEILANDIVMLQSQPGRAIQSLAQSSFDTWIKLYRPDENSHNSSISYYLKGSLVALLLDLEIRQRTGGQRSLDDVMRYLYHEGFGGDETAISASAGFDEEHGFLAAIEAVAGEAGGAYRDFLARYVGTGDELDYERALGYVGVRMNWEYKAERRGDAAPASLGVRFKKDSGRTRIAVVYAGSAAETAGLYANDELVAFDGYRVDEERLTARIAEHVPGDLVTVTVFRGERLVQVPVTLGESAYDQLKLVPDENADAQVIDLRRQWLEGSK
ncbi:MAG TPA: PDZ domain-containing protein, partial [Roseiflexaceae bacterium]|nr:PDZ domain-containing protein [Roseiflexaceae bacterium]